LNIGHFLDFFNGGIISFSYFYFFECKDRIKEIESRCVNQVCTLEELQEVEEKAKNSWQKKIIYKKTFTNFS
jgi:hypothetical protein